MDKEEVAAVFISQPMRDRDKKAIERERKDILNTLPELVEDRRYLEIPMIANIVLTLNKPARCLGMSIQDMSNADLVVFAPGWRDARGCVVEHAVCLLYKIPYIEIQNDGNGYFITKDGRDG